MNYVKKKDLSNLIGLEKYNWNPFKKVPVNVSIGTPISYELELDEIIEQWRQQITSMNGYTLENLEPKKAEESVPV